MLAKMKRKIKGIFLGLAVCSGMVVSCGCNQTVFDTEYTFEKAVVCIGGEWQEVEIKKWTDYEDGDQIQIETKDGYVYLVHSNNITLIHKK